MHTHAHAHTHTDTCLVYISPVSHTYTHTHTWVHIKFYDCCPFQVFGEVEEFSSAIEKVIRDVRFDSDVIVSVFETNIRVLG